MAGRLRDVVVEHEIYGQITVDLILENRCDVQDFLDKISKSTARPLSILTNGKHYHTVEADREEIIDRIEAKTAASRLFTGNNLKKTLDFFVRM